jgi:type IV secretion system protein TrbL
VNDLSVIDQFTTVFSQYIDSGFGLLGPDVGFLTTVLIGIDVVLAGLFWLLEGEENIVARFARKVLYVGFFAFILNNFNGLSKIIFNSFAGLGLEATGAGLTPQQFLQPGQLALVGVQAGQPILTYISTLMGFVRFFENFVQIAIMFIAWIVVVVSFFILAIQLFIAIIEFKLTTLAGFVLVPFALWKGTAFLAERVLGNVISSGIKILVLAVIVGIGTTIFGEFTTAMQGTPTLNTAMALVLASLALFGLGIFGPGIAGGLVAGAPQLGAGAAIGTAAGAIGLGVAGVSLAAGGARLAGGLAGSTVRSAASLAGGTRMAYSLGAATSGKTGIRAAGGGLGGIARTGGSAAVSGVRSAVSRMTKPVRESFSAGEQTAFTATGGTVSEAPASAPTPGGGDQPAWARRLQARQRLHAGASAAHHAVRQGDHSGLGASPDLSEHQP